MSVVTRSKRLGEAFDATPEMVPAVAAARHEAEAPERSDRREAPETRNARSAEAPEAADGRASYLEQEFTHGRSQS